MSAIRKLFMAMLLTAIFFYGMLITIGSFSVSNNLAINATVKAQYIAVTSNHGGFGGILANLTGLQSTVASNQQNLQNPNLLTLVVNSVSMAANFFSGILSYYNAIAAFAAIPLTNILHIPWTFAFAISQIAIIGIIGLAIISAIFLFPT